MNALQSKRSQLCAAWVAIGIAAQGCAGVAKKPEHVESDDFAAAAEPSGPVHIALPRQSTAVRDDRKAPILQVSSTGDVVFPTVYGYPIFPEGDAAQGILMLRRDNWSSVKRSQKTDEAGVVHEIESYADLGCSIDGVRENANKFIPLSLSCEVPAPKSLGGAKRPVLGELMAGAKADQVLKDKSVEDVFLGAWHLTSGDFDAGSGSGYFNTTHGQLAFQFAKKKLQRVIYYFDPAVKGWQNPTLWVKP